MKATVAIRGMAAAIAAAIAAGSAWADGPYVLVAGRRDPRIAIIDLDKALKAGDAPSPDAVVARVRVTPDVLVDGMPVPASGLPSNVVVAPDGRTAFVVNHAGNATPAATNAFQHGHLGTVAVLDMRRALDPANNNTTNAIRALIPTGFWGPVGFGLVPGGKHALVSNSEGQGKEDGAREISVLDLRTGAHVQTVLLALGDGGKVPQDPDKSCAELAGNPALRPMRIPDANFGCFPATNGLGVVARHGGYAFAANGGTDDVSVIDIGRALRGDPKAEVARIPVERGPWGLAVDPGGKLVAVTNRESAEVAVGADPDEGNTISLIDVHDAIRGDRSAERARVRVGTDDPSVRTRPFSLAFTPDGRHIVVTNFRTNSVSIVDVRRALAGGLTGGSGAEVETIPLVKPGVGAPRPRGVAVTPDGHYAVVSGGGQFTTDLPLGAYGLFCEQVTAPENCGALWVIDLRTRTVVATVTGVGNEPYMVDVTHGPSRRD